MRRIAQPAKRRRPQPKVVAGFKVFASDLSSPVQGGAPVWDGSVPFELPRVRLDKGPQDCAPGWNFCRELSLALRIAGLWPRTGRPARVFSVEGEAPVERGDKLRAATLRVTRELTAEEIEAGVRELSKAFAPHADWMADEQIAWRRALARPSAGRWVTDVTNHRGGGSTLMPRRDIRLLTIEDLMMARLKWSRETVRQRRQGAAA